MSTNDTVTVMASGASGIAPSEEQFTQALTQACTSLAMQLLADAYDDRFDTALLISADSDLTTPVSAARAKFPGKNIIVALPPNRRSHQLTQAASGSFIINETAYRRSQLPAQVQRADGFVLQRPAHWR